MKENPEKALRYNERKKINLRAARALNKVQKEIKVVEEEAEEKKQKKRKEKVSNNNDIRHAEACLLSYWEGMYLLLVIITCHQSYFFVIHSLQKLKNPIQVTIPLDFTKEVIILLDRVTDFQLNFPVK